MIFGFVSASALARAPSAWYYQQTDALRIAAVLLVAQPNLRVLLFRANRQLALISLNTIATRGNCDDG